MQYFIGFVFPGSATADNWRGGKLESHLMASCVINISVKNYLNLIILFKVAIEYVHDVFFQTQCIFSASCIYLFVGSHANDAISHSRQSHLLPCTLRGLSSTLCLKKT